MGKVKIKMNCLTILGFHFLLFATALTLPANNIESKSRIGLTTIAPAKDLKPEKTKDEATFHKANKVGNSKSAAKKRDIQQELLGKPEDLDKENQEDSYGGKSVEEYAKVLALRPFSDNARIENAILKAESFGDPASMNEYRYYGGEDRKKRTAIYNRPVTYPRRELGLTTDDVIAFLTLIQQQKPKIYNALTQRQWSDFVNSLDFQENDSGEYEDVYNDSSENRFENLYPRERFLGNYAEEKRFMVSKRNSILGKPKLAVPIYRRAVL